MLYNTRWDKPEVKANPFSLESLIAWLETQPTNQGYCYTDHGRCLLSQYFASFGFSEVQIFSGGIWQHDGSPLTDQYPIVFDAIALGNPFNRTFGAALDLARKALAEQNL